VLPKAPRSRPSRPVAPRVAACPLPSSNTAVDYASLQELGTIMGSGGMVVMDHSTNIGGPRRVLHGVLPG